MSKGRQARRGPFETVENIVSGTKLHLGDGRRLAFGETALVKLEVAEFLRGRGQVR